MKDDILIVDVAVRVGRLGGHGRKKQGMGRCLSKRISFGGEQQQIQDSRKAEITFHCLAGQANFLPLHQEKYSLRLVIPLSRFGAWYLQLFLRHVVCSKLRVGSLQSITKQHYLTFW